MELKVLKCVQEYWAIGLNRMESYKYQEISLWDIIPGTWNKYWG